MYIKHVISKSRDYIESLFKDFKGNLCDFNLQTKTFAI